jgi:alpha-glucosidase
LTAPIPPGHEAGRPLLPDAPWWRQAVIYQIYPRSFADSNADGVGDLAGITSRVGYLASLGVDALWLSPFYPSALADGGYDVDDYRDVDPSLGTLADFDAMVVALHEAGIRVLIDIVPNHTSDRHAWFVEAVASPPGSAARARYHIRDGTGPGGSEPPSDWQSIFGGPAWTRLPDGQWYLHLFAPEQPDLNHDDPSVREDLLQTLRFWSDRGVDGFRVDATAHLSKDLTEPLAPWADLLAGTLAPSEHPFTDRDEVREIFAQWRRVLDSYDPPRMAIAEAFVDRDRRYRYTGPGDLGQLFNFDLLGSPWLPAELRRVVDDSLQDARAAGVPTNWVLSNHDVVRHASRYGLPQVAGEPVAVLGVSKAWLRSDGTTPTLDAALGLRRARAATLLMLALPGSAYLYQGEELGLHEVADLPAEVLQDPAVVRSAGRTKGRDGCRVPLPWTRTGPSLGFGGDGAHLPQPDWFGPCSVEAQDGDTSTLSLYREALAWRRRLCLADASATSLEWVPGEPDTVLHLRRPGGWHSVTNLGPAPQPLPAGRVVVSSAPLDDGLLPAEATAWVVVTDEGAP